MNPDQIEVRDLEYRSGRLLDVFAPPGDEPKPVAILMHGAGLDRHNYARFARRLAEHGMVVFNIDWTVLEVETGIQDVACAIRFAAQRSPEWGGRADRTTLVAHSTAFAVAGAVATAMDLELQACPLGPAPAPSGLVGISPFSVVGGDVWQRTLLGGNPALRIRLIEGNDDPLVRTGSSKRTVEVLSSAGYETDAVFVDGGHFNIVLVDVDGVPPAEDADETLAAVDEIVRR
jgi:poly(3-hydroxybutyrate) depolymerase